MASRLAVSVVLLLASSPSAAGTAPGQPMRAFDFGDDVGVNIHSAVSKTQFDALLKDAEFLNIHHLRDGIRPLQAGDSALKLRLAAAAGIDWDIIIPAAPGPYLPWLTAHRANLGSLEGPNEPNLEKLRFGGVIGTPAAALVQHDLYQDIKSDTALARTEVINYSMGYYGAPQQPENLAADFDAQNLHIYPGHGRPPAHDLSSILRLARSWSGAPIIVSEIGYATTMQGRGRVPGCAGGVSPQQQAVYLLDSLLDDAARGVSRTYLYDLIDDGKDPGGCDKEDHYGLFNLDGSPKPAAWAVRNLLGQLSDRGPGAARFRTTTLTYTVDAGISALLVETSTGVFDLVLWGESVPVHMATLTVGSPVSFAVFDPVTGSRPIATSGTSQTLRVAIGDDPIIVQMTPARTHGVSP